MKVLMTADTVGGVWTQSIDLASGLSSQGVEICLATMGPMPSDSQRCEALQVKDLELHCSNYKLEWMRDCWDDVSEASRWLLRLAERFSPDVVHLNGYCHSRLPWNMPVVVVSHSCVLSWWRGVHHEEAPEEWRRYAREVTLGLHAADVVVAPSRSMLSMLRETYGEPEQSRVIYNGRNSKRL